ncbi:MAG: hypothetical protein ACRD5L_17195 [Bryobacteraceae bacterium]
MRKSSDVDDAVKATQVDRKAFEDAVRKMLQTPPTSKAEISRKIHAIRYRPLKPGPKRSSGR